MAARSFCKRVARAHAGANLHRQIAALQRKLLDLAQRLLEILLNVVGERLQR